MENTNNIIVVGGSNGEYILELLDNFELGQKHLVTSQQLIGGGGVNYTLRLINMGYSVLPIFPLGKDEIGKNIQHILLANTQKILKNSKIIKFIAAPEFLHGKIRTQMSTIIIHGEGRSIFTEKPQGLETFLEFIQESIENINKLVLQQISALVIGDIYADNHQFYPENAGKCTQYLIDLFEKKVLIYANPGKSQIYLGYNFWREYLQKVSILQLNIIELKILFQNNSKSLIEIIETLIKDKINTIITLDKFGLIAIYAKAPKKLIFAHPLPVSQVKDTTGAGDALGAGIVAQLHTLGEFSWEEFKGAIAKARIWSAYACTQLGGGANCPNSEQLQKFKQEILPDHDENRGIEIYTLESMKTIIQLLDKIY